MRKIIFGEPLIGKEEIREVIDTLNSGWIGMGPKCIKFEQQFADYIGCKYALAVSSCTAALHLSLIVSGVRPGDEVITTPLTFVATVNSIWHVGARPILVDINPQTLNIDVNLIERSITRKTKAIIPVHFGGLACEMDKINKIARKYRLIVIEDAAHAIGAIYKGKKIGNLGNLTCFSFYANKNITTAEGGMITINNNKFSKEIESLKLQGLGGDAWKRFGSKKLILAEIAYPGFKYNMTDLQASLGVWQLKKIEEFLKIRQKYAEVYNQVFKDIPFVRLQFRPKGIILNRHALHLYVLILEKNKFKKNRNQIVQELKSNGIGAAIHYEAIHLSKFYKKHLKYQRGDLPIAEYVGNNILSLPLTPKMNIDDVRWTAETTKKVLLNNLK